MSDSHHVCVQEHRLLTYVDTNFISSVQYKLSGAHLMHVGFGDFDMSTPLGVISFRRLSDDTADNVLPVRSGRAHLVRGSEPAIQAMMLAMVGESEDMSQKGGLTP